MKLKRILSLVLCSFMAVSSIGFTANAADDDVVINYTKMQRGICDNEDTGTVEIVSDSEKGDVVKFTANPAAVINNYLTIDGYNANEFNIDVAKYKYMHIEMKFESSTIEAIKPVMRFLKTAEGNIEGAPYVESVNALKADGKWQTITIDMNAALASKIEGMSNTVMAHLQFLCGGRDYKASAFGNGDAIYISKVILSNESTASPETITVKTPQSESSSSSNGSSSSKYTAGDLVIPYTKMQRGICDHKDTGKIETVKDSEMGDVVLFTINANSQDDDFITIDGYGSEPLNIDVTKYQYMIVDMKFESSKIEEIYPIMRYLSTTEGNLTGAPYLKSSDALVSDGKWYKICVNMKTGLAKALTGLDSAVMKHFQFSCGGRDVKATEFGDGDKIYIANVTFTNTNPNADKEYKINFVSGFNNAVGENPADIVGKPGTKFTLPEIPYTAEGFDCLGWLAENSTTPVKPGTELEISDVNMTYTAAWQQYTEAKELIAIDYAPYYCGICDHVDTATGEVKSFNSKTVIEVIPNPETTSTRGEAINLDGWSYGGAKIDTSVYKTLIIEYLYLSDNPVSGKAKFNIMSRNFAKSTYLVSKEDIVEGRWATYSFDLTQTAPNIVETSLPIIGQAHIYPLGDNSVKNMSANDRIYIGKIIAIPEESTSSAYHEAFINGYDDGTFGINGNMTRAEACTIVARLAAAGDANIPTDKVSSFTDVNDGDWYNKYVAYVESLGYLKSYSGEFKPNQNITRAEFVELVYNMGLLADNGKNGTFTDVPADHARATVIAAAGKAGLVNGYDNGDGTFCFKPDNTITRAEVVKVINNAYGKAPSADGFFESAKTKFSDVTADHWAFADIIDASVTHISYIDANGKENWKYIFDTELVSEDFNPDYETGLAVMAEYENKIQSRVEEIRATASMDLSKITGKKIYVSTSGNDANNGLSESAPVKTIAAALKLSATGDAILFKRGDEWRERFTTIPGITYTAYGTGAKPVINGNEYGDAADPSLWTLVDGTTNIWLYNKNIPDVGNIVVNGGEKVIEKLISNMKFENGKQLVSGALINPAVHLAEDNYFTCVYSSVSGENAGLDDSKLYVRCDAGNPGEVYDSIELAYRGHTVTGRSNITMDNLCIKYCGSHGIGMGTVKNTIFTNLEIGWIGGSAQNTTGGSMTRFGNGIEIYGGCDNYVIDNCYVYQCYDAGITNQKQSGGADSCTEENVYFTNNVIDKCIYNIEYFMGIADTSGVTRLLKNINYKNNILARSGYGWGMNPSRSASLKGWDHHNNRSEGFYVENNVFFMDRVNASDLGCGNVAWLPAYKDNIYIQRYGNTLTKLGANGATQYMMDGTAANFLEKYVGEKGAKLYYVPADTEVK